MIEQLVWLFWTAVYMFFTFLGLTWLYRMYDYNSQNHNGSKPKSRKRRSWFGNAMNRLNGINSDRSRSRERSTGGMDDMDRSRDRNMDRSLDRNMDRSLDRNMDRSRDRNMDRSLDRNMESPRDRNLDSSRDRNRDRSLDRNMDRSRDRHMDSSKERNMESSRDRNMERSRDRNMNRSRDRNMDKAIARTTENMDCMDTTMNRMGKLDCLDLDRIDGTPRLRSRSNSINRVQSETRCEDKGDRNRSNSRNRLRTESQAEAKEEHITSSLGGSRYKKMLHGKTVIVTNGHKGIGYETSKDLARRGARVIIGCRNRDRGMTAARKIIEQTGNKNVTVMTLDLGSLQSVREFAREVNSTLEKVDILVNYSGSGNLMIDQRISQDGYDLTLQTNHFAHFLLTNLIKESMDRSDERRIINVSALAARDCMDFGIKIDYDSIVKGRPFAMNNWNEHTSATSMFMNCLFSAEIPRRWKGYKSYSLHPGVVGSDNFNKMKTPNNWKFVPLVRGVMNVALVYGKTPRQGAECAIFCCLDENLDSGEFFSDMRSAFDNHMREQNYKKGPWNTRSYEITDPEMGRELWDFSARLVEL